MTPELKTEIILSAVGLLLGLLITIVGFLIKAILEDIKVDIKELKTNSIEFTSFASRVDTILTYQDKQISSAFKMLENDRPRREI